MQLDSTLSSAASGLASIAAQLATVSQNVSNASTPGYVVETRQVSSADAAGEGAGVRTGVVTRTVDATLQGNLAVAGAQVADSQVRQGVLAAVDAASGTPGDGTDLASLVGALRDGFSALLNDPSDATQQGQVVQAAATLAQGVNGVGAAISTARQSTQDNLVVDIAAANTALQTVGTLSRQILAARAQGQCTANLEDQRDTAAATVTQLTGARFLPQADGSLLAVSGGTILPLTGTALAIAPAALSPGAAGPPLTVSGQPVSLGAPGGTIGAEVAVRDTVLPGLQSGLDGFAQNLATGFAGAGLTLFTDTTGTVPSAGTAGFAQSIQVNPAVSAAPNLVRDGTAGTAGPVGSTAGNTAVITAVLASALAIGAGTLAGQASGLVSSHATLAASATAQVTTDTAVQSSLHAKLGAQTGVSVDSELSQLVALQNSYGANAKVIAAVQSAYADLFASVTSTP